MSDRQQHKVNYTMRNQQVDQMDPEIVFVNYRPYKQPQTKEMSSPRANSNGSQKLAQQQIFLKKQYNKNHLNLNQKNLNIRRREKEVSQKSLKRMVQNPTSRSRQRKSVQQSLDVNSLVKPLDFMKTMDNIPNMNLQDSAEHLVPAHKNLFTTVCSPKTYAKTQAQTQAQTQVQTQNQTQVQTENYNSPIASPRQPLSATNRSFNADRTRGQTLHKFSSRNSAAGDLTQRTMLRTAMLDNEAQELKTSGGLNYTLSSNTLRQPNLQYSFSKSLRRDPSSFVQTKTQDLIYTLPSTLKKGGPSFANKTEVRDNTQFLKSKPGLHSPPPNTYAVKRLFDRHKEGNRINQNKRLIFSRQCNRIVGSIQSTSTERCTFGISHDNYRGVVVGSTQFLGSEQYASSTKVNVICEKNPLKRSADHPGFVYNLNSTLKERDYNIQSSGKPCSPSNINSQRQSTSSQYTTMTNVNRIRLAPSNRSDYRSSHVVGAHTEPLSPKNMSLKHFEQPKMPKFKQNDQNQGAVHGMSGNLSDQFHPQQQNSGDVYFDEGEGQQHQIQDFVLASSDHQTSNKQPFNSSGSYQSLGYKNTRRRTDNVKYVQVKRMAKKD